MMRGEHAKPKGKWKEVSAELLVDFRKREDEEDEARCLVEEMQRNLDTDQKKVMKQNKSCVPFGSMSKPLTKNEDARKLS